MKKLVAALLTAGTLTVGFAGTATAAQYGEKSPNPHGKSHVHGHRASVSCTAAEGAKGKVKFTFHKKGFTKSATKNYTPGVSFSAAGLAPGHYKATVSFKGANGWSSKTVTKWFWVK